jgi:hypothetical protein
LRLFGRQVVTVEQQTQQARPPAVVVDR